MFSLRAAAISTLAGLASCAEGKAPPDGPDLVLITFDALPEASLGLLGAAPSLTPELDAFAARTRRFESASPASWSLPALASWMSGEAPAAHACESPSAVLDGRHATLAERLLAAGYDTACVISEPFAGARHGLTQGFVHADESAATPEVDPALARPAQALADAAIRFLDQRAAAPDGRPWFLWLHCVVPRADEAGLRALDAQLGRLLARLAAEERVGVLLTAAGPDRRVPFLLRAPGLAPGLAQGAASALDVLPTLLALARQPAPVELSGRALAEAAP